MEQIYFERPEPCVVELTEPTPAGETQHLVVRHMNLAVRQYTSDEWEAKRDIIKRLYVDEGKALSVVMKEMETEHQFKATAKMFKTRLKQWNYMKNCTGNEVAKYFRLKRQREATGDMSESQAVEDFDCQRVERYLKRKTARLDSMEQTSLKFALQHHLSAPTPSL